MFSAATSLTTQPMRMPSVFASRCERHVVLPAPRNPESSDTGVGDGGCTVAAETEAASKAHRSRAILVIIDVIVAVPRFGERRSPGALFVTPWRRNAPWSLVSGSVYGKRRLCEYRFIGVTVMTSNGGGAVRTASVQVVASESDRPNGASS